MLSKLSRTPDSRVDFSLDLQHHGSSSGELARIHTGRGACVDIVHTRVFGDRTERVGLYIASMNP